MTNRVTTTLENHIAHVQMVRGDKMNALDPAMFEALIGAGEALMDRTDVRCVVLSGEGRAFCAGLDMASMNTIAGADNAAKLTDRTHGDSNLFQRVAMVWRDVPMPVIAAVHGTAFGGGFQIMLGADIRYVAPDTRLSVMEIRWGLIPDMGGAVLMPLLARDDVVRELTFTGRIFSGAEALEYGFATRLCDDPLAEAMASAAAIAAHSPDAIRQGKALLNGRFADTRAAMLMDESLRQARLVGKPNQIEAVMAGMQKRAGVFGDAG